MKNKIIATILTLLIVGGIVASTVNETARVIVVFIAACLMLVTLATILGFCIYQLVKIVRNEED
jgi:high-affinity Fe2+/Pb2+ permease